ncbi:MAG: hypothetical protein N2037_00510 [Acidimicrobiales bacterium]|nr:hypothetical protein [Acidimicrobiales bacterium]
MTIEGGEICDIAGVGSVAVSAIENLLGAATLALVLTGGVDVLNVVILDGLPSRTSGQRCRGESVVDGCDEELGFEIDDFTGWDATCVTRLGRQHHALKTHRGWTLSRPDPTSGKRKLQPPPVRDIS